MARIVLILAIVGGLSEAGSARAAQIDVTYSLTVDRTLAGLGIPVGPTGSGHMVLRFSALGPAPGSIVAGPVTNLSLSLYQAYSFTEPGGARITGYHRSVFPSPGSGTLTPGWRLITFGTDTHFKSVHCIGTPRCTSLFSAGGLSRTESVPSLYSYTNAPPPQGFSWGNPTTPQISFGFAGPILVFPVALTIVGHEVSRSFVPEPTRPVLLGLGLLMLGLSAVRSVRRGAPWT